MLWRGFARAPMVVAVVITVVVFAWIALGTVALTPLATPLFDERAIANFARDGAVRWPGAAILLLLLWRARGGLTLDFVGRPSWPVWFPWATITLGVAALIRLSVVTQFWDQGGYTLATVFSELSTGVFEELAFRGVMLSGLVLGLGRSRGGVRKALLITTVLFGVVHGAAGWGAIIVTLLFGAVFLLSTLELRSLWPAAVLHGLFDVGVNGAPPAGVAQWNETLTTFASVALLLAGLVALVRFGFWSRWPAAALKDPGDGERLTVQR